MSDAKRVELNPGEWFMVADPTVLVEEFESIIGNVAKIGGEPRTAYLFTFTGKRNNHDERMTVTVAMDLQAAWDLVGQVLAGLELVAAVQRGDGR